MKVSTLRLLLLAGSLLVSLHAQPVPPEEPTTTAAPDTTNRDERPRRGNGNQRPNFDPAQMQQRMMDRLREQMDVKDDAEWALISERITAINELRRTQLVGAIGAMMGGMGGRAGAGGAALARFAGPGAGAANNPELDALRSALAEKLPDAEITSRLTKLRDARKQAEAKLEKAHEDLRAVLTVRQEAIAVMLGLLN